MTNLLIQELPFFLASSLLAGLGLLLVLGLALRIPPGAVRLAAMSRRPNVEGP